MEDRLCTVQQYVSFAAMLRRLLITDAKPTVVLLSQENPSYDGVDLFLSLLERYGTKSHDSASASLERLHMPYNDAISKGIVSGPLDMLAMLLGARNALGENDMNLPADLTMEYILRAFTDSPLSSYVADVRSRTDKTLTKVVQDIQEIGAKKEADMKTTKCVDAAVNAAETRIDHKHQEKDVPPGELFCPVQCARGYHPKDQPCPGLVDLFKQWGWREPDHRFCTHCQKSGHTVDGCFRLKPELRPASWLCDICHKPGHFAATCTEKNKLSEEDLKAIAKAICVAADPGGQFHATSPAPVHPSRIQVHGRS